MRARKICGLVFSFFSFLGCIDSPKINNSLKQAFHPGIIGNELPASRFLSKQFEENPRVDNRRSGYDKNYRLLTYRRLEKIPPNPRPTDPKHIKGVRSGARVIQKPEIRGDESDFKSLIKNNKDPKGLWE